MEKPSSIEYKVVDRRTYKNDVEQNNRNEILAITLHPIIGLELNLDDSIWFIWPSALHLYFLFMIFYDILKLP